MAGDPCYQDGYKTGMSGVSMNKTLPTHWNGGDWQRGYKAGAATREKAKGTGMELKNAFQNGRLKAQQEIQNRIENGLTSYKVIYDDGTAYVTSMGEKVSLDDAKNYFMGKSFVTHEDEKTGKETKKKVIKVEKA